MGVCRRRAACIADPRNLLRVIDRLEDIQRARVFAIAPARRTPMTSTPCAAIRACAWRWASCLNHDHDHDHDRPGQPTEDAPVGERTIPRALASVMAEMIDMTKSLKNCLISVDMLVQMMAATL